MPEVNETLEELTGVLQVVADHVGQEGPEDIVDTIAMIVKFEAEVWLDEAQHILEHWDAHPGEALEDELWGDRLKECPDGN